MPLTPQQVLDEVVALEKDLAAFYKELRELPAMKPFDKTLRFMAQHSSIHAEMIANYRSDIKSPQLDINPLTQLHDRVKDSLKEELTAVQNSTDAARKMAETEEILSLAYAKIAEHYTKASDSYKMIANKFQSLAADERQHSDYIRKHI